MKNKNLKTTIEKNEGQGVEVPLDELPLVTKRSAERTKPKMFIRSPYNYDRSLVSFENGFECTDLSLTQQHQLQESDINYIVKQYGITGQIHTSVRQPMYGDFSGISDYAGALAAITAAQDSFYMLPSAVRERFNNDPREFVEFCLDDRNADEAKRLGLVVDKVPENKDNTEKAAEKAAPNATT